MDISTVDVTARELAALLGITDRRVRQLVDEGVLQRSERGRYPLKACLNGYVAAIEGAAESSDLQAERLKLIRAQRRRIELSNERAEATSQQLDSQDALVSAISAAWFLGIRPVADWLHDELTRRGHGKDARIIAGTVNNWLIGLRAECEKSIRTAAETARRQGTIISSASEIAKLSGGAFSGLHDDDDDD